MKKINYILIILIEIFLFGCDNNLSRQQAERLIKERRHLPYTIKNGKSTPKNITTIATMDFGEITATVESSEHNSVNVKYTLVETPAKTGKELFNAKKSILEMTTTFKKTENGWEMEK